MVAEAVEKINVSFGRLDAQLGPLGAVNAGEEEATPSETATTASTTSPAASPGPSSTTRVSHWSLEPVNKCSWIPNENFRSQVAVKILKKNQDMLVETM